MSRVFVKKNGAIACVPYDSIENLHDIVWIDLINPNTTEETMFESLFGINIPSYNEMQEIGVPSKLYQTLNALYFTANIAAKVNDLEYKLEPITFILTKNIFITVRYTDGVGFKGVVENIEKSHFTEVSSASTFVMILNLIIDNAVDSLEHVGSNIDEMSCKIFESEKNDKLNYQDILKHIGKIGGIISKTRESLTTLNRVVVFMLQSNVQNITKDLSDRLKVLARDISALNDHATFSANKVNFLLDATLGMINIEQNNIIKIFSVAAVVFLPPTLIASIYGMNFDFMPELKWHFGYPMAIAVMVLSSWLPYKYFKYRKWL